VAARPKAWICGLSLAGIAGSNPVRDMDLCLLRVLCVVRWRSLRRADPSSRGVLTIVVCVRACVCVFMRACECGWVCVRARACE
jgi:hypothetical protein